MSNSLFEVGLYNIDDIVMKAIEVWRSKHLCSKGLLLLKKQDLDRFEVEL